MRIGLVTKNLFRRHRAAGHFVWPCVLGFACVTTSVAVHGQQALKLTIQWDKTTVVSKSTPTFQVEVNW